MVQLANLDALVFEAKRRAFAKGTSLNLRSQWRTYLLFCDYYQLRPLPASSDTICRYIIHLSNSLTSYQSIKNYLHGVAVLHKCYGIPVEVMSSFDVKLVLQSVKRQLCKSPNSKLPIQPDMLLQFRKVLNLSSPLQASLWAAILIGFFAFLRKANIVPPSAASFHPATHLARGNITRTAYGLSINLSHTKTIQYQDRQLQIPIAAVPGHALDPADAFDRMTALIPAPPTSPAFVYPDSSGRLVTFTHASFQSNLRSLIRAIGINPSNYSGHSLRRGGCSAHLPSLQPSLQS